MLRLPQVCGRTRPHNLDLSSSHRRLGPHENGLQSLLPCQSIDRLRTTPDYLIVTSCATSRAAPLSMTSCSSLGRQQPIQGSPLPPESLHQLLYCIKRIQKTCQHAYATGLLRTLHSFLKPLPRFSLFSTGSLRALHRVYGLLGTENSCTPDALVYVRSDKYLETSSERRNPSNDASRVETSASYWRLKKADKSALNLNYPFQGLNSSCQPDPSSSRCVSFVGANRARPLLHGPCTSSEVAHDILLWNTGKGCNQPTRHCLFKPGRYVCLEDKPRAFSMMKERRFAPTNRQLGGSYGEPEDNAGSIQRVEDGSSRAPADGETSKKPPRRQRQNSHYDEGTNGTTKASKKRKQDSVERDDDDFDESGRGGGRPNTGKRRKDEEEESEKNKFACPFYKNDPQAFRASRTCVGPGWSSIHRVKSVTS